MRERLADHPLRAARLILGSVLEVGPVRARIVEVEAYGSPEYGRWPDPAAHTYPGPTPRNEVMFGPAGHLYVYLSYGIHQCVNITAGPDGEGGGVLLRAASIESGLDLVRERRGVRDPDARLAAGPGRLGQALGITVADKGIDVLTPDSEVRLQIAGRRGPVASGPRIGITKAVDLPWRLWLQGHPSVSR
ncbi:DNA-3-methyladenine glycosylase [Tsukamurella strandjordii]|uniref:Putative 3-methyladenine DNA glycosylase n=1 Tax=Tsukamurella strandjordii TaxID=147577 RepID=A0AA90SNT2_9ACTN|nr:DNA-3-methyladenine glycosylase [Tsukamurella strandjordii]MDP0400478.1 DNA-3-methyladenine glycosylase [Tsukamurella strandjordii]